MDFFLKGLTHEFGQIFNFPFNFAYGILRLRNVVWTRFGVISYHCSAMVGRANVVSWSWNIHRCHHGDGAHHNVKMFMFYQYGKFEVKSFKDDFYMIYS